MKSERQGCVLGGKEGILLGNEHKRSLCFFTEFLSAGMPPPVQNVLERHLSWVRAKLSGGHGPRGE